MRRALAIAGASLLWGGTSVSAHRLDEYLQATMIEVGKDRVHVQMYLTPGVAVFPAVLAAIDTDRDGAISAAEQRAYADRVLGDLSLTIDGKPLRLHSVSSTFADVEEMRLGSGGIAVEFFADSGSSNGRRRLIFENHHQSRIAAYLVNCVTQHELQVQVIAQKRNYLQSLYQLDYVQAAPGPERLPPGRTYRAAWAGTAALLLLAPLALRWRKRS